MSIMQPPQSPSKPKPTLRTRVEAERDHFEEMPYRRLFLLLLPNILLLYIDPLVPIIAYLLQIWAGSSHTWRERWASLVAGAKRCAIILAALALYLLLNHAQVWIIPTLTDDVQRFWQTYLPGILSLSLVNGQSLLARSLLLLPLAPILAVYDERIDPRTGKPLNRVLMPNDLKPKPPKRKTAPVAPPPASAPTAASNPSTPASHTTPPKKTTDPNAAASQKITIESYLASQPAEEKKPGPPAQPATTNTDRPPSTPPAQQPPEKKKINWDTVLE